MKVEFTEDQVKLLLAALDAVGRELSKPPSWKGKRTHRPTGV